MFETFSLFDTFMISGTGGSMAISIFPLRQKVKHLKNLDLQMQILGMVTFPNFFKTHRSRNSGPISDVF